MKFRIIFLLIPILLLAFPTGEKLELVESIPIETNLDNSDIRNTAEVWPEMINGAKKSLDIAQFYISHKSGEALTPILDALYRTADRGVKIRFILDGNMYKTYPETADQLKEYPNIEVRIYQLSKISGSVQHAKYFCVDNKEIFLGSQNFDWRALDHIHELGVRILDKKLAGFYQELFELDWRLAAEDADSDAILASLKQKTDLVQFQLKSKNYGEIEIIPTASNPRIIFHLENRDEKQILNMIANANESIRIQLLSYSPLSGKELYEELDFALRRAAARGVKVQMILSDWNFYSSRIQYIKSLHLIPNIEIKFSTIPEASSGYIGYARVEHCKYMLVDDAALWLGTSNWSKSYFHKGRNLGIILRNKKIAKRMSEIFLKSWNSEYCQPVDPGRHYIIKRTSED